MIIFHEIEKYSICIALGVTAIVRERRFVDSSSNPDQDCYESILLVPL